MSNLKESLLSLSTEAYIPPTVAKLLRRIAGEEFPTIALFGFSSNMKWLYRLLREQGQHPILCDWRDEFIGYDCGGDRVTSIDELKGRTDVLVVACHEEYNALKSSVRYLIDRHFDELPVIYELAHFPDPFNYESPYREIANRARARARSMISDQQLFELIQLIKATAPVEGAVAEFGSYQGGSGAVIVEAVNHYGKKPVWLFDSFAGIPKSRYGLDHRWQGSFSNNSYAEIKNAFKDCDHVKVIQGNICETYSQVEGPLSFCYIASDTLETGELLLNFAWPRLSPGGIIIICDYASLPNCVPLTVYTDKFLEDKPEAFVFRTSPAGIFIMKR